MEKNLENRRTLVEQALSTLETVIKKHQEMDLHDFYFQEVSDSLIQRFEYSIDTFWKYLKEYLITNHQAIPGNSPRAVFNCARDTGLITSEQFSHLLKMIEHRNLTSHAYDQHLARTIIVSIPSYAPTLNAILASLAA